MKEYLYKVSVIVPVYNVENYLRTCLDSLKNQTMDSSEYEVLLVDDGSTDTSLDICYEYAQSGFIFKVFHKENEGVSKTRNFGIRHAQGKYLMFLDSDDTYTPGTVKLVSDFFDKHYNEIDVVSYYDQYFENGKPCAPHARYKYLTKTGIYDLSQGNNIFAMQVRLNIVIKNLWDETLLFDEIMSYQEDQKYCCKLLQEKLKLGFVKEAQYNYLKNDTSIVATSTNVMTIFDNTINFFEEIFNSYPDNVPSYYQQLFIHDIGWKIKQHCLFPYHYSGDDFEIQNNRLMALIKRLNVQELLKAPTMDNFHKYYFMILANKEKMLVYPEEKMLSILYEDQVLKTENACEIIVNKLKYKGNTLKMLAMFKSVYGTLLESPEIYAKEYTAEGVREVKIETFLSSDSYYKAREITNHFFGFYYEPCMDEVVSFELFVEICGVRYPARYYFMPKTPFFKNANRKTTLMGEYSLSFSDNVFSIEKITSKAKLELISKYTKNVKDKEILSVRKEIVKMLDKKIWLYYDCKNVKGDNGYYQFEHDADINDGIERYYISNNPVEFAMEYIDSRYIDKIVVFGSIKHKILFTACDKILTAYIEPYNYNPLTDPEYSQLSDLIHFELIYLQHGVLHAHLPWKYTPERCLADRVVVSSYFECKNFCENYCFRSEDILPTGMGRFNHISDAKPEDTSKRILFAPTWRQYLISQAADGSWIAENNKFLKSSYFEQFSKFLNDEILIKYLEDNDVILEMKNHPIFEVYEELFEVGSDRIKIVDKIDNQNDYSMMITDFSSFTFDFGFCRMPVVYFIPDMREFEAGMNQYRKLDLSWDDAFGPLVTDAEAAVNEVVKIIENEFKPEDKYMSNMINFYLPMEDCCEALYQKLIQE